MRQARSAMRAGAGASRAAAKDNLRAGNPKWQPGMSPLEEEERLRVIVPTNAQQMRQINTMIDTLLQDGGLDSDVRKALAMWKTNYQMESVPDQVRRAFLEGFWCWLLGRGSEEQTKRTLWGRANVAAHNSEVAAYLELFARKRTEYAARLVLMAENVPDTLVGFYLYWKYVVNGAAKKIQDPGDPTKWFWSLSDEQFLEDWDLFEQEGGNYAHMIEPAAKRPAGALPFGGAETNTHPTDPYPAQPSDRTLHACMDNLAKQIMDLNQSLSLSHVDSAAAMSLSRRRTQSTEPGSLAGAGNDSVVMATVHEEEEFDVDGGDGNDEVAQLDESSVIAEKLSESVAASRELSESIRELIAEQRKRMVEPTGERAAVREAVVAEKEALKEAAGADNTPEAKERVANAAAVLEAMEFMPTPTTPVSPVTAEVQTLSPTVRPSGFKTPSTERVVQDVNDAFDKKLQAEQVAMEAELEKAETVMHAKAIVAGHKAQVLGLLHEKIRAIETLQPRADTLSLSDLHSSGTMAALSTAQTPPPKDKEEMSSNVQLADSGTPVAPIEQSSSTDTPLGVLAARQRMRAIALAPTGGEKVQEVGAGGEVVTGRELGLGDSEGSSAALSEHSSDRDFIVGDSNASSSAAVSSAQEDTGTITDSSAVADSLLDISAVMQADDDDDYKPAAKAVAKAALEVQKVATRASKKKEEEIAKQVRFSGNTKDV